MPSIQSLVIVIFISSAYSLTLIPDKKKEDHGSSVDYYLTFEEEEYAAIDYTLASIPCAKKESDVGEFVYRFSGSVDRRKISLGNASIRWPKEVCGCEARLSPTGIVLLATLVPGMTTALLSLTAIVCVTIGVYFYKKKLALLKINAVTPKTCETTWQP